MDDVNSPGSSVSSGSEIAGFYWNRNATELETEFCKDGSDDEAGAAPYEHKSTREVHPASALALSDIEDYNKHLDDL